VRKVTGVVKVTGTLEVTLAAIVTGVEKLAGVVRVTETLEVTMVAIVTGVHGKSDQSCKGKRGGKVTGWRW
jgi:hypothetical protein